ncbi:MAG TPA: hypothetical protein VFN79_03070 [Steroidobacteraceae bacterium]|nr:hypothetical protein [Steroidobacteraceae bacterium]
MMEIHRLGVRHSLHAVAVAAAVVLLVACASAPPPAESSAHPSAVVASGASAAISPTEKPAPTSKLIAQADLVKQAWQAGLPVHVEIANGDPLYCWSDSDVGSMIPSTKCLTESQLQSVLTQRREARQRLQTRAANACNNPTLCGG